jgi:ribosomal RNA-processing protein 8
LDRFSEKLQGSKFRWINELLYTKPSDESKSLFDSDPSLFDTYHTGFESQVKKWPVNPLDRMIARVKKMDKSLVIADMGCGTAQLALQVPQKVHSFDMVARNERITAADMAHVPLPDASVDVVIYCLSLMGTNVADFLRESNRILRPNGKVLVAEVSSRFEDVQKFVSGWSELGFRCTQQDLKGSFFFYFEFEKTEAKPNRKTVVTLRPCMYKKR